METILSIRPCILQTIIICSTIVIVCLIGVSAYRVYKSQQRSWGSYIFLASALLLLAITIFSHCFCQDRNVLDFISLASALISIILAVITIIYSYYTNSSNSTQIEKLNKAAEDVSAATATYTNSANELQENITRIIESINKVNKKTDELMLMMQPTKTTLTTTNTTSKKTETLNEVANKFIENLAPLQIILIYLCAKSKNSKKPWSIDLLPNSLQHSAIGILITLNSTGLIKINTDYKTVEVHNLHSTLEEKVVPLMGEIVKVDNLEGIKEIKHNIDSFFS